MSMMPPTAPPSAPAPAEPQAGGEEVKTQLIQLLKQAAAVAAKNGIDFKALIMEVLGGGGQPSAPAPRPPMP